MPYHRDGTAVGVGSGGLFNGVQSWLSGADLIELNDPDYAQVGQSIQNNEAGVLFFFFPEQRTVTGYFAQMSNASIAGNFSPSVSITGSSDSTNGLDGTWETATTTTAAIGDAYSWRSGICAVSFTGAKRVIRIALADTIGNDQQKIVLAHVYGKKTTGQTPDDLIFINHQDTPGVEYTAPQDFGDRPLGTTVTHQFRVKNASATKTASTISIQCNDSDFAISSDNTNWVTTLSIASLAAGAQSATLYVRNTTPGAGNLLGPRYAEIVATVGSWA